MIETYDGSQGSALDAAICIVGGGAAGIALACELDGCGVSVLLLECGGLHADPGHADEIYRGTALEPHPATTEFRHTGWGGTTGTWGGRCVPFDPIDFEQRDYVPESGWPIPYEEVARHYPRALAYCDAGAFDFTTAGSLAADASARSTIPGLRDDAILRAELIERYSLPTDFGKRYRDRLARSTNVRVLLQARCIALHRDPAAERITSLTMAGAGGRRATVRAGAIVLAVGGLETPRLLLHSDAGGPGLGNQSDCVGRYYTCHFENVAGRLEVRRGRAAFDFEKTRDGVYCRRKLQFTDRAQREHRLLNTAFRLHFPPYSDAAHGSAVLSAIYLAKSALIPEYQAILQHGAQPEVASPAAAHLANVLRGMPQLAAFAWKWAFLRHLARRKLPYTLVANRDGTYPLEFNSEQTPLAGSRITLGRDADPDGVPRIRVDWRLAPEDLAAAGRAFRLLQSTLERQSDCRLLLDEERLPQLLSRSIPVGGHHMGTTRMAATAQRGVVDRDCAVYGCGNLYVASASVFPTSSHANPTLTIVALAVRLADHLKRRTPGAAAGPSC